MISKVKSILNMNQEKKIACCGRKMVLGKWLLREHIGVRHVHRKSTMVLGKRFPREHIGVARKYLGKNGHLKERTLSDVPKEKTFDWWSKGRVTSEIDVSPPKNLNTGKVQRITKNKVVLAIFQVTERLQVLMCTCEWMMTTKLCWIIGFTLMLIGCRTKVVFQVGKIISPYSYKY